MPGWCWCRAAAVSPRLPTSPTTIGPCCGTKWTSPAARCARSRLATSSTWARWAISCANCMCTSSRVAKAMPHGPGRSGVTARRSPMASLPCTNAWPRCAMHWRCRRSVETAHIQFERLAEDALLLRFGERIDATINARVQVAVDVLQHRLPSLECVPAYASVLLRFDPLAWRDADSADPHQALERVVRAALDAGEAPPRPPRDQEIPVCYGGVHGPDLARCRFRRPAPGIGARGSRRTRCGRGSAAAAPRSGDPGVLWRRPRAGSGRGGATARPERKSYPCLSTIPSLRPCPLFLFFLALL